MKSLLAALLLVSMSVAPFRHPLGFAFAIDCGNNNVYHIIRTYKGNAFQESMYIYQGTATGTQVYYKNGLNLANTQATYDICLANGLHTIVLTDTYAPRAPCHLLAARTAGVTALASS